MARVLFIVVNVLPGHHRLGFRRQICPGVRIRERKVLRPGRDADPDAVAFLEDVGDFAHADFVALNLAWLKQLRLGKGMAVAGADDSVRQPDGVALFIDVAHAHQPVRIPRRACRVQDSRDFPCDRDFFLQRLRGVD